MHAFVEQLLRHPVLGPMVVHQRRVPAAPARYGQPESPLDADLTEALARQGIQRLWGHQARGLDLTHGGRNVLLVTPTASGKSLLFSTTILRAWREDPQSRALLLYPTKALARDQLAGLRATAFGLGALRPPRFEIYDGDTPAAQRSRIRADPPEALITNPDMLHMGLLAHHRDWEGLLSRLKWIVLDELHVYRGIFGANVHHILARLQRLCMRYGASPRFIAASATIGNPAEFAQTLVGQPFAVIDRSGAPRSAREVLFVNPAGVSPYTVAVRVLSEAVQSGLRTIAFTKARRITELLYTWLVQQEPRLADRVAPYRAGYLPEERRRLEQRLFSGDLSAILTTSALELGIDVGGLDVCVLVGYPGSLTSSWQRIGRVGRNSREGLVVLVAMPDALDQYVVHHPDLFFGESFERAVLDPWNPLIAGPHYVCAAAEEPLGRDELARRDPRCLALATDLARSGRLVEDAGATRFFSFRRRPQREVNPRSAGQPYTIIDARSGKTMGSIDGTRVHYECHPGAIYLHGGQSYLVEVLDREKRRVLARRTRVDYYTVILGEKETEILERLERGRLGPFAVGLGRLKVTVHVREYQKKRLYDGEPISTHPLDLPPLIFETVGLWIELPAGLARACAERELHFMGGIHATEHAAIGLFPLLAIADRGDVGGISYTGHPQTGGPAIFIYDGLPGGAGLAQQGYANLAQHLARTLERVRGCACEEGCPGCIQSPKCGNGNKPLDKQAALLVLRLLTGVESLESLGVEPDPPAEGPLPPFVARPRDPPRRHGVARAGNRDPLETIGPRRPRETARPKEEPTTSRTLIFDLETQRSAEDVGGWIHRDRMGLALAVCYDMRRESYTTYYEGDVDRLLLDLVMADRVVGFNLDQFDLEVLAGYTRWDLGRIRTLDLLSEIHDRMGFRLSLAHLCEANLGESKSGDGLQSLQWWKQGRIDLIEQYCKKDVDLTRRLFELGRRQGYLLYRDREERLMRVPVSW